MAKTIKFNLMCDGYPCRNIEDVQEHFCIEDMLEYYESGLLKRWLEVRGFKDELAEVEAIKATEVLQITEELIRIFEILTDEDKVKEAVSLINYQKKRQAANQVNEERGYQSATVISNYVSGYDSIIKEMMKKSTPSKVVQQHINTLATDYQPLFEKNIYPLFITSLIERPLVCLNLLYNDHSRAFLAPKNYLLYADWDDKKTDLELLGEIIQYYGGWGNLRYHEVFLAVQPQQFSLLLIRTIMGKVEYRDYDQLSEIFENELHFVNYSMAKEEHVLENKSTRCLICCFPDADSMKYKFKGKMTRAYDLEPFLITNGLHTNDFDELDCRMQVVYFKVDD